MGLRDEVIAGIREAFDGAEDLVLAGTVKRVTPEYQPGAGTLTETTATSTCRILPDSNRPAVRNQLAGVEVRVTDKILWVEGSTIDINQGDLVETDDGSLSVSVVFADDVALLGALHLVVGR